MYSHVYVYMCICIGVNMCEYGRIYANIIYTCMYLYIYIHIYYTYMCIYAYIYTCICIYICIYVYMLFYIILQFNMSACEKGLSPSKSPFLLGHCVDMWEDNHSLPKSTGQCVCMWEGTFSTKVCESISLGGVMRRIYCCKKCYNGAVQDVTNHSLLPKSFPRK